MSKRWMRTWSAIAVAMYVVIALFAFLADKLPATKVGAPLSVSRADTQDMLPVSRSMPAFKQSFEAAEHPSITNDLWFFMILTAVVTTVATLSLCDAHYKARALKIQTARWCAS